MSLLPEMKPNPVFDYKKDGIVFIQNGTIFYSPNSSRLVKIPPSCNNEPFKQPRLNIAMFKQPVWWSMSWGWQSFVPLSPSFTSSPFEAFCWMPHIEEVHIFSNLPSGVEKRYQMAQDDILNWKHRETLITEAAQIIRLQYKISSNIPPLPSSFHYDKPHKSFNVAKKMISISRDWFVIWMGFLSYIISQTKVEHPNSVAVVPPSPLPFWYEYLRDSHNYQDSWLDGLSSSAVCSFDIKTPRAGVVFQWSIEDSTRPPIDYFLDNHVPMYFMWTSKEEQAISIDYKLAYLQPPTDLVQEALTILFSTPNVPLAGLITQQYFGLSSNTVTKETLQFLSLEHATSFVFNFVANKFVNQTTALQQLPAGASSTIKALAASREKEIHAAAELAVAFPFHGMLDRDRDEDTGKLYNHFEEFFTARDRRQAEIIKVESSLDRQRRESREKNPGIQSSTMYTWEKTRSSGGKELYMRVRVRKKCNEDVYSQYRPSQRRYNAFSNEWDFCYEFHFGSDRGCDSDSDDDDFYNNNGPELDNAIADSDDDDYYNNDKEFDNAIDDGRQDISPSKSQMCPSFPQGGPMVTDTDEIALPFPCRDVLETAKLVYGYVSPYDVPTTPTKFTWHALLGYLGFAGSLSDLTVTELDERAILVFFDNLSKGSGVPAHLLDLTNGTLGSSSSLFDFSTIRRTSKDLFVFHSPRSSACQWVLGVHSPVAALYICRYILTNPVAHTLLTVSHRLVERGIPFRTLLPLRCSPHQASISQEFTPTSHRPVHHTFTVADFETSMLQCQTVLSSPQGRAALLRGGIVARIAKQFISNDRVYEGPSVEVTAHRVGYIVPSDNGTRLCDDDLTEHEVAIICGTYSLYTGMYTSSFVLILFSILLFQRTNKKRCGHGFLLRVHGKPHVVVTNGLIGLSAVRTSLSKFCMIFGTTIYHQNRVKAGLII
jgi:hypothetical protein